MALIRSGPCDACHSWCTGLNKFGLCPRCSRPRVDHSGRAWVVLALVVFAGLVALLTYFDPLGLR